MKNVTFNSCGGSDVASQEVATGSTATRPVDPTKPSEGSTSYSFLGWYTEEIGGELFDFDTPINSDITLYAHWEPHTITGYTLYFETNGGTSIEPQVVPMDGTKFTKPTDPTKASDSVYQYSFHKWYTDNTLSTEFDFNATPTGDAIAYAGYANQGYQPSGYSTIDPKRKSDVWGTDEMKADYGAWELESTETFTYNQPAFPNIRLNVIPNGSTNSGAKLVKTSEVRINNTKVRYQITDPTKYFSAFRLELIVKDYSQSHSKLATLSTGSVTSDSGYTPYDSNEHQSLVLIGNCEGKPQEFTLDIGDISANGTRLRYIYAMIGTYTTEEIAINYATDFNDANVCGTLDTDGLNETKWSQQAQLFDGIGTDAQAYLREYEGSNSEIIECLQRYDRVITIHGTSYDFMGRVEAGKINLGSTKTISTILLNQKNDLTILIVLISLLSVSTICGYVLAKKYSRKKDN